MIIRRHGYDPDKQIISLLSFSRFEDGYKVEYIINPTIVITEIVCNIFIDVDDLIIHTPENW